jgi:hypothetical protein
MAALFCSDSMVSLNKSICLGAVVPRMAMGCLARLFLLPIFILAVPAALAGRLASRAIDCIL